MHGTRGEGYDELRPFKVTKRYKPYKMLTKRVGSLIQPPLYFQSGLKPTNSLQSSIGDVQVCRESNVSPDCKTSLYSKLLLISNFSANIRLDARRPSIVTSNEMLPDTTESISSSPHKTSVINLWKLQIDFIWLKSFTRFIFSRYRIRHFDEPKCSSQQLSNRK